MLGSFANLSCQKKKIARFDFSAVLSPTMFTRKDLLDLRDSGKVNGMVLLGFNDTDPDLLPPDQYSDDDVCPNNPSSLYGPSDPAFCSADKVKTRSPNLLKG